MRALVSSSHRLAVTPDGHVWAPIATSDYAFWARYLEVFDEVLLMTRCQAVDVPARGWSRATGPGVVGAPLPDFHGPFELAGRLPAARRAVKCALAEPVAVILRVPSLISAFFTTGTGRRPFGVEVVGDPYDVFAPGAFRSPLRRLYRHAFSVQLAWECRRAVAAAYVTAEALQQRYPAGPTAFTTHYSSVQLRASAFRATPRTYASEGRRVAFVGTLSQLYKAPDVLLEALGIAVRGGADLELAIAGDGHYREWLEQQAVALGLGGRVRFLGRLSGWKAVRDLLDSADLFALPSRQEGLPRAMIEAMARALPCLGTRAGGIPELLGPSELVPVDDAGALAAKLVELAADPARLTRLSASNLEIARDYSEEVLQPRRIAFYEAVADATKRWLRG